MSLIYGKNEAHDRLMKEVHETNSRGTQYPHATNNRGYEGGSEDHAEQTGERALRRSTGSHEPKHNKREHHADGDVVGNRSQPGARLPAAMKHGGHRQRHADGEEAEMGKKPMKRGGHRMHHAEGGELDVPKKYEQPGEVLKKKSHGDHMESKHRKNECYGGR